MAVWSHEANPLAWHGYWTEKMANTQRGRRLDDLGSGGHGRQEDREIGEAADSRTGCS